MTEVTLENVSLPAEQLLVALREAIKQIEIYGACEFELGGEVLIQLTANEFDSELGEIVIKY
jgi:hypothetical protein